MRVSLTLTTSAVEGLLSPRNLKATTSPSFRRDCLRFKFGAGVGVDGGGVGGVGGVGVGGVGGVGVVGGGVVGGGGGGGGVGRGQWRVSGG